MTSTEIHKPSLKNIKKGKKSRSKGGRTEREVCKIIALHFGYSLQNSDIGTEKHYMSHIKRVARSHQKKMGDVWLSEEMRLRFPYSIESKSRKSFDITNLFNTQTSWFDEWWDQTCEQAMGTNLKPLLLFKKNNSPWMAATILDENRKKEIVRNAMILKNDIYIMKLEDFLNTMYAR